MPLTTINLTSNSTFSSPVSINWLGGMPTTVGITMPSTTGSLDCTIQFTLQDFQRAGGSSLVTWFNYGSSGIGTHYSTANLVTFLGRICGVRLQSTNISSGPLTGYVVQGEAW